MTDIVDRVSGDSFASTMIYGLNAYDDRRQGLEFAIATALRNCGRQSGYKPCVKSYWRCISPALAGL
jgi:sugar/nucleoside kinase (ribokinase family)